MVKNSYTRGKSTLSYWLFFSLFLFFLGCKSAAAYLSMVVPRICFSIIIVTSFFLLFWMPNTCWLYTRENWWRQNGESKNKQKQSKCTALSGQRRRSRQACWMNVKRGCAHGEALCARRTLSLLFGIDVSQGFFFLELREIAESFSTPGQFRHTELTQRQKQKKKPRSDYFLLLLLPFTS